MQMELYKLKDRNRARFIKTPKDLFLNKCYKNILTSDAKLIYSLLIDRMQLSKKNEWVNENNEIYLIYTKENLAEMLGVSNRTVYKSFKLLEKVELVKQERQGLNKPNKIYIGKTNPDIARNCKICRSEPEKCAGQELQNLQSNDTELNDTDFNETDKKRYIAFASNDYPSSIIYNKIYKKHFNKEHPRINEDDIFFIREDLQELYYSYDKKEFIELINYHFNNLPKDNDGKVQYFLFIKDRYIKEG